LDVTPRFKEKPNIHLPELSLKRPYALAILDLPIDLPSVLSFINGSARAVHVLVDIP